MENVLKYYEFSDFIKDKSKSFLGNEIAYSELNATHFLIFEKYLETFNLYVSKYANKTDIGIKPPQLLELLVQNYDKSNPEHRIALKQYLS